MTPAALALALGTSFGWAALDALRKRLAAHLTPAALVVGLTFGTLPAFVVWLALGDEARLTRAYWLPGSTAVALNVGANLLFMRALQVAPLSTTIPMLSFTPAFTVLSSALLLRELPGARALCGVLLVVVSARVLQAAPHAAGRASRAHLRDDGPRLMLVVAALWSLVSVLDKASLAHAAAPWHGAVQCAGVGLAALGLLLARGRAHELGALREVRGTLLAAALVSALALGLQFMAFQLTYVSSVEALKRSLGMLASLVGGRVFFGEPLGARQGAGVAGMIGGVILILA